MHAELSTIQYAPRVQVIPAQAAGISLEALPVASYLHLRSAGRGLELEGLNKMALDVLGVDLSRVNAIAPLHDGSDSCECYAMRTRPSEVVLLAVSVDGRLNPASRALLDACLQAAEIEPLLHTVDAGHGQAAIRLQGLQARDLLLRLADATSLPQTIGSATRLRMAEMHVTLIWTNPDSYLLFVDRLYADFLTDRLVYASGALDFPL